FVVHKHDCITDDDFEKNISTITQKFNFPVFVKPARAGSSVGAKKACDKNELREALSNAFLWDTKILVEPFVHCREIECAITGNTHICSYTLGEICPTHDFYDYEAKYIDPQGAVLQIPPVLSENSIAEIKRIAEKAYQVLDVTGFSRVDFFIEKNTNAIFLNEINTIPGFTSISMFPKMCEASGLHYVDLIEKLLTLALERYTEQQQLRTSL
ncbi:MAG: ATP-grasp domain-containing protein, partial [Treponemataceae bacterium]